jgi:hypothetical protein
MAEDLSRTWEKNIQLKRAIIGTSQFARAGSGYQDKPDGAQP